jgi:hypothetical protein
MKKYKTTPVISEYGKSLNKHFHKENPPLPKGYEVCWKKSKIPRMKIIPYT